MKKAHIGVQSMLLGPEITKNGLYETLERCAEIGVYYVEISQPVSLTPENVAVLQRAKKELGIQVSAVSAFVEPMHVEEWDEIFDNLQEDFDKIVADCRALGCTAVRISALPFEALGSRESAVAYAREIDKVGARMKAEGIDLYFHTHDAEFAKYDGQYVLDIIRDNAPNIGFELDIYWIQHGGADPVQVIRDYAGRVRLLHLKDYRVNGKKYAEGGWDAQVVEYGEVGEGNLPIRACIEAGLEGGCEYFFIEQDETYGRTPLESLKISHDNLVAMGYGEMFLPE